MARITFEDRKTLTLKEVNRLRKKLKLKPITAEEWKHACAESEREYEKLMRKLFPRVSTCYLPRTRY